MNKDEEKKEAKETEQDLKISQNNLSILEQEYD
jgi:hypothetical protein